MNNNLGPEGCRALAEALQINRSIISLMSVILSIRMISLPFLSCLITDLLPSVSGGIISDPLVLGQWLRHCK
jgi:hypothetical protein